MGSSIVFHGYHHDGTTGLIDHVLELCVEEFGRDDASLSKPGLREFFERCHNGFGSGSYVFLRVELIQAPEDAVFLAELFGRVFARLQRPESELSETGLDMVATNLMPLVDRLRQYANGELPHASAPEGAAG